MTVPVLLRPKSEADVRIAFDEYEQVQTGLGQQFSERLREVLERIETQPGLYGVVWQNVRAARLKRFRFLVYYLDFPDRVEVLAVMHAHAIRSPGSLARE